MIELTRLRHGESFLINPDLLERIDSHVDTVVRLTNGHEYLVTESAAEILERIMLFRARVLAAGLTLQDAGVSASYVNSRNQLGPGSDALTEPISPEPTSLEPTWPEPISSAPNSPAPNSKDETP